MKASLLLFAALTTALLYSTSAGKTKVDRLTLLETVESNEVGGPFYDRKTEKCSNKNEKTSQKGSTKVLKTYLKTVKSKVEKTCYGTVTESTVCDNVVSKASALTNWQATAECGAEEDFAYCMYVEPDVSLLVPAGVSDIVSDGTTCGLTGTFKSVTDTLSSSQSQKYKYINSQYELMTAEYIAELTTESAMIGTQIQISANGNTTVESFLSDNGITFSSKFGTSYQASYVSQSSSVSYSTMLEAFESRLYSSYYLVEGSLTMCYVEEQTWYSQYESLIVVLSSVAEVLQACTDSSSVMAFLTSAEVETEIAEYTTLYAGECTDQVGQIALGFDSTFSSTLVTTVETAIIESETTLTTITQEETSMIGTCTSESSDPIDLILDYDNPVFAALSDSSAGSSCSPSGIVTTSGGFDVTTSSYTYIRSESITISSSATAVMNGEGECGGPILCSDSFGSLACETFQNSTATEVTDGFYNEHLGFGCLYTESCSSYATLQAFVEAATTEYSYVFIQDSFEYYYISSSTETWAQTVMANLLLVDTSAKFLETIEADTGVIGVSTATTISTFAAQYSFLSVVEETETVIGSYRMVYSSSLTSTKISAITTTVTSLSTISSTVIAEAISLTAATCADVEDVDLVVLIPANSVQGGPNRQDPCVFEGAATTYYGAIATSADLTVQYVESSSSDITSTEYWEEFAATSRAVVGEAISTGDGTYTTAVEEAATAAGVTLSSSVSNTEIRTSYAFSTQASYTFSSVEAVFSSSSITEYFYVENSDAYSYAMANIDGFAAMVESGTVQVYATDVEALTAVSSSTGCVYFEAETTLAKSLSVNTEISVSTRTTSTVETYAKFGFSSSFTTEQVETLNVAVSTSASIIAQNYKTAAFNGAYDCENDVDEGIYMYLPLETLMGRMFGTVVDGDGCSPSGAGISYLAQNFAEKTFNYKYVSDYSGSSTSNADFIVNQGTGFGGPIFSAGSNTEVTFTEYESLVATGSLYFTDGVEEGCGYACSDGVGCSSYSTDADLVATGFSLVVVEYSYFYYYYLSLTTTDAATLRASWILESTWESALTYLASSSTSVGCDVQTQIQVAGAYYASRLEVVEITVTVGYREYFFSKNANYEFYLEFNSIYVSFDWTAVFVTIISDIEDVGSACSVDSSTQDLFLAYSTSASNFIANRFLFLCDIDGFLVDVVDFLDMTYEFKEVTDSITDSAALVDGTVTGAVGPFAVTTDYGYTYSVQTTVEASVSLATFFWGDTMAYACSFGLCDGLTDAASLVASAFTSFCIVENSATQAYIEFYKDSDSDWSSVYDLSTFDTMSNCIGKIKADTTVLLISELTWVVSNYVSDSSFYLSVSVTDSGTAICDLAFGFDGSLDYASFQSIWESNFEAIRARWEARFNYVLGEYTPSTDEGSEAQSSTAGGHSTSGATEGETSHETTAGGEGTDETTEDEGTNAATTEDEGTHAATTEDEGTDEATTEDLGTDEATTEDDGTHAGTTDHGEGTTDGDVSNTDYSGSEDGSTDQSDAATHGSEGTDEGSDQTGPDIMTTDGDATADLSDATI